MSNAFAQAIDSEAFQQEKLLVFNNREVIATIAQEALPSSFLKRAVPLEDNELISPLPATSDDPVGKDISDIANVCSVIQENWDSGGHLNNISSWTLARHLKQRVRSVLRDNDDSNPNKVDLLITGQEVSLWAGEQFAADMSLLFPKVRAS